VGAKPSGVRSKVHLDVNIRYYALVCTLAPVNPMKFLHRFNHQSIIDVETRVLSVLSMNYFWQFWLGHCSVQDCKWPFLAIKEMAKAHCNL
jgi:hypothetical protein